MERFLQEVIGQPLIINNTGMDALELLVRNIQQKEVSQLKTGKYIVRIVGSDKGEQLLSYDSPFDMPGCGDDNPFDQYPEGSVAIIPLVGMMTKYGSWWSYGVDDIANMVRQATASDKIKCMVLLTNTPGGTTASVYQFEDALRNNTKPIVGLVDGMAMSGGKYSISFCDKILAMNRMCQVGNIGTMMSLVNSTESDKQYGYKRIEVYPPESKFKNLAVREALNGDTKRLIEEQLTPWAIHFQNTVKENRPGIDTSVEGILGGRDFYAYDAVANGLIDGIGNMNDAVNLALQLCDERKQTYSLFKN
jgi:protease-4